MVYASDVTFIDNGEVRGKPTRVQQEASGSVDTVPDYILERYGKESCARWHVVFGFKMPDETFRACQTYISTTVPALSEDEIRNYYSDSSSAGLLLVKLLKDRYPHSIYQMTDASGKLIAEISSDMAWQLIVEKVPPTRMLKKLLFEDAKLSNQEGGQALGLFSFSLLELLQESENNKIELRLKDGSRGFIRWITPNDYSQVSEMLADNFNNSPSYAQLSDLARAEYIAANTVTSIAADVAREDVVAAYTLKNDSEELIGYILVRNGISKSFNGAPSAVIKRIHTRIGQVGKGIGEALLKLSEEAAKASGLSEIGVGASGSSCSFFQKNGFQSVEEGKNPVLSMRGVDASWNYLEKQLL